jgi:hypothetical protein
MALQSASGKMYKTLSKEQMPIENIQTQTIEDSFLTFAKHLWDILDKTILEAAANAKKKDLQESFTDSGSTYDGSPEPRIRVAWIRFLQPEWIQALSERQQLQVFLLVCARILANTVSEDIRQMIRFKLDPLSPPRLVRQTAVSSWDFEIKPLTDEESRKLNTPRILPAYAIHPYDLDPVRDTPLMNAWKRIWLNYDNSLTHLYYDMISFLGTTKIYQEDIEESFPGTLHGVFNLLSCDHLETEIERAQLLRAADAAAGWLKNAPCCLPAGILHCSDSL